MTLLYGILLRMLAIQPLIVLHAIGTVFGLALWWLHSRQRQVSLTNLALCMPHHSEPERRRLTRASLIHFGRAVSESPRLWLGSDRTVRRLIRDIHGMDAVHSALGEGRGVILLTPHLGSWEMAGLFGSILHPTTTLYKPLKTPVDSLIKTGRERFGARLVPTDGAGVRHFLRALGRGEIVGMMPDQDPPHGCGVFAPFFDVSAHTPVLASRLAARTGAAVFSGYAERLPRGRGYDMHFVAGLSGVRDPDNARAAHAMNEGIEACIQRSPEQYWWGYKRFRRRPSGESGPY